jgi:hypothetical protein
MKAFVGSLGLAIASVVAAAAYSLPPERPIVLPPGPGADLAAAHCSACHSLDYVTTQPRGQGAQFWADNVRKMIDTHGAEIAPEDEAAIVAYLGRTFG